MSSVTASAVIGGAPPYRGGVEATWTAFLHEGAGIAWQISPVDPIRDTAELVTAPDRPRTRWIQCHGLSTALDLLRIGVHLWCSPTDNDVARLLRAELARLGLSEHDRLDIAGLPAADQDRLLRLAATSPGVDTTVMLSIYNTSALRGAGSTFFATPGWQGEWAETAGGQCYRCFPQDWRTWTEP
jgi:hypothetical protein